MKEMFVGQHERRAAPIGKCDSTILSTPLDGGRVVEGDMVHCCHCGRAWLWVKGANFRGWCTRCAGYTCRPGGCHLLGDWCVPYEQFLSNLEALRPYDWTPVTASVPAPVPGSSVIVAGN